MTDFREVFAEATGESLFAGTLNIKVTELVPIREHFRIEDPLAAEQDLLFEVCRANGLWAYRIRPCNRQTGEGGHGDDVIEIACSVKIPNADPGGTIDLEFFR